MKVDNTDPDASGHYWGSDPNEKYGWGTHTTRPVPVYYQGAGGEFFEEVIGEGYTAYGEKVAGVDGFIDQVHIAQAQFAAFGVESEPQPDPVSEPVFGSAEDDVTEVTGSDNLIFAGAGNDLVDASFSEVDNRIYGGSGDDDFILGTGDRFVGAEGADRFFATTGGDNTITGGEGADQFWIAVAEIPDSPNTFTDFMSGEDVIGIAGLDIEFSDLTFTDITMGMGFSGLSLAQSDNNTLISANGDDLAILLDVESSSLSEADFAIV